MAPFQPLSRAALGLAQNVRRHRKILRDNIQGVTKPAIRRLARRGGVKRISGQIYDEIRSVIKLRLRVIVKQLVEILNLCQRSTVRVTDIIFVLRRLGTPIYGFDNTKQTKEVRALNNAYV